MMCAGSSAGNASRGSLRRVPASLDPQPGNLHRQTPCIPRFRISTARSSFSQHVKFAQVAQLEEQSGPSGYGKGRGSTPRLRVCRSALRVRDADVSVWEACVKGNLVEDAERRVTRSGRSKPTEEMAYGPLLVRVQPPVSVRVSQLAESFESRLGEVAGSSPAPHLCAGSSAVEHGGTSVNRRRRWFDSIPARRCKDQICERV